MKNFFLTILFLISFSFHNEAQKARLKPWFSTKIKFENPLGLVKAPGLETYIFILEQRGKIFCMSDLEGATDKKLFLNLQSIVSQNGSETGLLGLAFHPKFAQNGRLFVSYTSGKGNELKSYITEFQANENRILPIKNPKPKIIMSVKQPYTNHNGGAICFGPDGFLYFSWGDGGAGGDPLDNAQNLASYLGKIHRIDVDHPASGKEYGIPASNPFVSNKIALPEIFAYGLRNVWQMHFDLKTKKLWAGDVGQNAHEEIDIIEAGKNYGWKVMEGKSIYAPDHPNKKAAFKSPEFTYPQTEGNQSVTGGFVYDGGHSIWKGNYIFGDFMSGRIWLYSPQRKNAILLVDNDKLRISPSCFGKNRKGEILVCDYGQGQIFQLIPL